MSCWKVSSSGADSGGGGGAPGAPKIGKKYDFLRKIVIFHTPKIGKKHDFFGVKSWFFTRNTPNIFAPPSARRNFFKLTIVSLLCLMMALYCIIFLNNDWRSSALFNKTNIIYMTYMFFFFLHFFLFVYNNMRQWINHL